LVLATRVKYFQVQLISCSMVFGILSFLKVHEMTMLSVWPRFRLLNQFTEFNKTWKNIMPSEATPTSYFILSYNW
jgi:hypothetical protein